MSINNEIETALSEFGVPVSFHRHSGSADTYITYFEYNQNAALNADDEEQNTNYYVQVDVWSKGNYLTLVEQVKNKLRSLNYIRTSESGFYEEDTKMYHKAIRFRKMK